MVGYAQTKGDAQGKAGYFCKVTVCAERYRDPPPNPSRCSLIGIEHETFNLGDTGSSPVTCTTPVWWNAYTLVSEASAKRHGGSNPSTGTKLC